MSSYESISESNQKTAGKAVSGWGGGMKELGNIIIHFFWPVASYFAAIFSATVTVPSAAKPDRIPLITFSPSIPA